MGIAVTEVKAGMSFVCLGTEVRLAGQEEGWVDMQGLGPWGPWEPQCRHRVR